MNVCFEAYVHYPIFFVSFFLFLEKLEKTPIKQKCEIEPIKEILGKEDRERLFE